MYIRAVYSLVERLPPPLGRRGRAEAAVLKPISRNHVYRCRTHIAENQGIRADRMVGSVTAETDLSKLHTPKFIPLKRKKRKVDCGIKSGVEMSQKSQSIVRSH